MNIKWPATSKTQENLEYVKKVLNKIGYIMGNPKLENAWVSDDASLDHFISFYARDTNSIVVKLSNCFGFEVSLEDKIYEIAIKLKEI